MATGQGTPGKPVTSEPQPTRQTPAQRPGDTAGHLNAKVQAEVFYPSTSTLRRHNYVNFKRPAIPR